MMISMGEARRFVFNIENIPTSKLQSILGLIEELKNKNQSNSIGEFLIERITTELNKRKQ